MHILSCFQTIYFSNNFGYNNGNLLDICLFFFFIFSHMLHFQYYFWN